MTHLHKQLADIRHLYAQKRMLVPIAFAIMAFIISYELYRKSYEAYNSTIGGSVSMTSLNNPALPLFLFIITLLGIILVIYTVLQIRTTRIEILEEYDREKTSFVRMASDTIKTPLTAIKWLTELFLGGNMGDLTLEQKENISRVSETVKRLIAQVNELLQISQVTHGSMRYEKEPNDLNQLIVSAIEEVQPLVESKKHRLSYRKVQGVEQVLVDYNLMRHVVEILLSNAVHTTPTGGTLRVFSQVRDDSFVIGISDMGNGVSEHDKEILFNKHSSMITENTGWNPDEYIFSLNVSEQIVKAADGKLWYEDQSPDGTTFYISIPKLN